MSIIKTELLEIKEKYGDQRRSKIEYAGGNFSIEDMIPDDKMVITISHAGYIKRTPLSDYKTKTGEGLAKKPLPPGMKISSKTFLWEPITSTCCFYPKRKMFLDACI